MEVRLRIAMLVIAARALETGWDQILVTRSWLALELNVQPNQAGKVLGKLEAIGWIRRVRGGGGGLRYRFCSLNTKELRDVAWEYSTAVDAVADGRPEDDELAQLISVIRHPAWAYAEALGHRAWLRLALPHMPTSDGRLGLGPASYRALTKALDRELPGALAGEIDFATVLDEYAETSLATYVHEDRRIDLQAEAAANRERLKAHRLDSDLKWEAIKGAQRTLREAWEAIGRVPDGVPTDSAAHREVIRLWVNAAAEHFAANPVEPEALTPLRVQLLGILAARGHDEVLRTRITDHVLPVG